MAKSIVTRRPAGLSASAGGALATTRRAKSSQRHPSAGQHVIDADEASMALLQAKAILELLHATCDSQPLELPDCACGTLSGSLLAAIRLIDDAKAMIDGEDGLSVSGPEAQS